jgi:pyrimidine operon attenuation protein/uracil phosphoribosyltransferase
MSRMIAELPDAEAALDALVERMHGGVAHDAALVGIYSGGAWVAERLAQRLPGDHALGFLDVAYYRDDYARKGLKPNTRRTTLPFDVAGATIVLVDDVLYTGRSVRAAINELFDYGRPARIMLAALVDRGERELPIAADFVAQTLALAPGERLVLQRADDGKLSFTVDHA